MTRVKRRWTILIAVAALLTGHVPAQAVWLGTLPEEQPVTVVLQNQGGSTAGITVYYLNDKGRIDEIVIVSVPSMETGSTELAAPGKATRRVVIEADPAPGSRLVVTVGTFNSFNADASERLVLDVE